MTQLIPEATNSSDHHASRIEEQFTLQARGFAVAPELHNEAALQLLICAGAPTRADRFLDVACGPGSVVAAFAPHVLESTGLDATQAMLDQGRKIQAARNLANVNWQKGSAYELPYPAGVFDIVACRFAFHHMEDPKAVFCEMVRVARSGARIVLCDGVASDDPAKADAFNAMERWRDPSTVEFRTLGFLKDLFSDNGLPVPVIDHYQVPYIAHELVAHSFPARDDRAGLLQLIEDSVDGDRLGMKAQRTDNGIHIAYQAVVLTTTKK